MLFYRARSLLEDNILIFGDLDFGRIKYPGWQISAWIAAVLVILAIGILLKATLGRNSFFQNNSGYLISDYFKRRSFNKFLHSLFAIFFLVGIFLLVLSLSNPFLPISRTLTDIKESRERIELIDVSASMGWPLGNSSRRPLAEIVRMEHLNFLNMRKNKNDRVALWLFSQTAVMVEDFIIDDILYANLVYDAPYVFVDPLNMILPENDPDDIMLDIAVSRDRREYKKSEGGTNLSGALQAIIKHFDNDGIRNIKERALVIVTDAAITGQYPEKEFLKLKNRFIRPYIIYIEANKEGPIHEPDYLQRFKNAEKLKNQISNYGGMYFDVSDKGGIERAYKEIDKLETVAYRQSYHVNKFFLFQNLIFLGILFVVGSTILLFAVQVFGIYP